MAPRPLRGKRRARNLALPFVVTAAAACTVKPATNAPGSQPASGTTPQHTVKGQSPHNHGANNTHDHRNAPKSPPNTNDHRGTAPASHGATHDHRDVGHTSNPPPPPTTDTGRVARPNPQGAAPTTGPAKPSDAKKPIVITNPPGPRKPALKPAPKTGGRVITQADGSCIWVKSIKCPKGASCNPPPPTKVQCPPMKRDSKAKK